MPLPTGKHTDWPWPFNQIERSSNAVVAPPPERLCGNTTLIPAFDDHGLPVLDANGVQVMAPKPIPNRGEWHLATGVDGKTPGYFAMTTSFGMHVRIGDRWDNVDGYFNRFSFKISFGVK